MKQVVSWASLVWHKAIVPRHTTNAWLFVLNRNPTLDRIHNWDAESLTTCLLCGLENESHDHLFFECQYSLQVWLRIINRLSSNSSIGLDSNFTLASSCPWGRLQTFGITTGLAGCYIFLMART